MTAETAACNRAVADCTVEITDEDENVVIAFIPLAAVVAMAVATITNNNDIIIGNSSSRSRSSATSSTTTTTIAEKS